MQAEYLMVDPPKVVSNADTNLAQRSLTLFMSGFVKGGTAYPLGVREGFARGTARALKKMLIFPNCSAKKCPIQNNS